MLAARLTNEPQHDGHFCPAGTVPVNHTNATIIPSSLMWSAARVFMSFLPRAAHALAAYDTVASFTVQGQTLVVRKPNTRAINPRTDFVRKSMSPLPSAYDKQAQL